MKRFLKGLGIFLALVGVGVASAFAVVALLLRQEEVRVPDLIGQDIVSVVEILTQSGLQLKVDRREPHPALPKDSVISQTPLAGNGIKKGRIVRVVVSQGPNEMLAPKLAGESSRKAEIMIRQAGFSPAGQSWVSSDSVERDVVIAQDPQAGSPLAKGARIGILISTGKRTASLVMPKLIGKKSEDAVRIVDRMGLQRRVLYKTPENRLATTERTVISQKPGPGYPIAADASVDIVVSK